MSQKEFDTQLWPEIANRIAAGKFRVNDV